MTTQNQAAVELSQTGVNEIPENAPKWESSAPEPLGNPCIVEVAFTDANTPKRESSAKPPRRVKNAERRSREFLTEAEVEKLMKAAEGKGRHGHRDATMLLLAYRHALRVGELTSLR